MPAAATPSISGHETMAITGRKGICYLGVWGRYKLNHTLILHLIKNLKFTGNLIFADNESKYSLKMITYLPPNTIVLFGPRSSCNKNTMYDFICKLQEYRSSFNYDVLKYWCVLNCVIFEKLVRLNNQ